MAPRPKPAKPPVVESDSDDDHSAKEPSDADVTGRLPPRRSKMEASQKWEMLKKKKQNQNGPRKKADPPPKPTKAKPAENKIRGRKEDPDHSSDNADDYHAPKSIQLNTSEDSNDDVPEAPKSPKSSQDGPKPHKHKPTSSKAAATVATRSSSRTVKKSSGGSGAHARKSDDASSFEESAEDDEEGEGAEDEGAIEEGAGAEELYWADGDDGAEDDGLDVPAARSVPTSPHRAPPTSKRQRPDSGNDSEEQPAPMQHPPLKKTKADPHAPREDDVGREPRRDEREPAQKVKRGKEKLVAEMSDSEGQRDNENERGKAKGKAKAKAEEEATKERAKAKARREKAKEKEGSKEKEKATKPKGIKSAPAARKLQDSDGRRTASGSNLSKRKHDEVVKWANKDKTAGDDEDGDMAPAKKRRADPHSSSEDSTDSDIDDHDTAIDLQCDKKGRPTLGEQPPRVRRVARLAIFAVKQNILLKCAFPDSAKDLQDLSRNTLVRCAHDAGYQDMVKRLKDSNQDDYWRKFTSFPAQRAFLMRGSVKKITDGTVAGVYGVQPGNSEKVEWLQKNFTFIYPHDYKALQVQSRGKLAFTLPIFESVLRAAFYDNPRSFGYKILPLFDSSLPEAPQEKEIPASTLALVATAIYASLDDYRPAKYRAGKFEANVYTPVFQRCILFLSKMKTKQPNKYHTLMHGLCQRLTGVVPGMGDFDDEVLDDFSADDD